MRVSLARYLLPLLLAFAFVVRWAPTRELELTPDEQRDLGGARWLLDDPDTCQELRRIELALAGDRVPVRDSFVNYPAGGEIPAFAAFDALVAGLAQRFLRTPQGAVELGGVDEVALEGFVVKLGPILGLLAVLASFWAARSLVSGPRGDVAALVAAAIVAFHPLLVTTTSAGRLDSAGFLIVLFALLLRSTLRAIQRPAMPASLLDALVAGGLAGVLVSSSAVGIVAFGAASCTFLLHAWRAGGEARSNALRSGVFFTIVAVFVTRLALPERPPDDLGVIAGFAEGLSLLVFFSVAPWLVLLLLDRSRRPSAFRVACFAVALGLFAWQAPRVFGLVAPAVRWYVSERDLVGVVLPSHAPLTLGIGTVLLALGSLVVVARAWVRRVDTVAVALGLTTLAFATASLESGLAAPLWVVSLACGLAHALDDESVTRRAVLAAAGVAFTLLVWALTPLFGSPDAARREARLDFVAGLRWLRTHTESSGPWNSPRTPSGFGVLSNVADGPLVLYHARRPALASPWGALEGPRALVETAARLNGRPGLAGLERLMQGQRARYVVVSADPLRRIREPVPVPSAGTPSSASDVLLEACSTDPPRTADGFVLEHASIRRVDADGATVLVPRAGRPVFAVWRLERFDAEPPRAELRAR